MIFAGIAVLLGSIFFFIQWSWIMIPRDQLARIATLRPKGIITGRVMPVARSNYQIKVYSFNNIKFNSKICLWDSISLNDGDFIQARGVLYPLPFATNPHQFDYGRYLLSQGNQAVFHPEHITVLSRSDNWADKLRNSLRERIYRYLYPHSNIIELVNALTIGDRSKINDSLRLNFQRGGLAHLLAISGLHVGIIFLLLTTFFKLIRVSKHWRYFLAGCLLLFYLLIAGANPSVWRAVIFAVVYSFAYIFQRNRDMFQILGIAGLVILLRHPLELWNSGFLLSFASVFALIFFFPDLWKLFKNSLKNKGVQWLTASFLTITVIYVGTWPILCCSYGEIYPVAWLSNLVMIPYLSILIVSILLFLLFPQLGGGVFTLSLKFLAGGFINLTDFFANLSNTVWRFTPPPYYQIFAYYLMLFCFKLWLNHRNYFRWWLISGLLFIFTFFYDDFTSSRSYILIFDVGQGDACLIHTEQGSNILIDGGPGNYVASNIILPYLLREGIDHLDLIIASHPDADHIGGLPGVIRNFPHCPVLTNGIRRNTDIYNDFSEAASATEVTVKSGYEIVGGDFQIKVLAPGESELHISKITDNQNAASLFLLVDLDSDSNIYIFPGDGILIDLDLPAQVGQIWLHASHHGDRSANPLEKLLSIFPQDLVISCGKHNSYGHPHEQLVWLAEIFNIRGWRTDVQGALKFYLPHLKCRCYNQRYLWHEYR